MVRRTSRRESAQRGALTRLTGAPKEARISSQTRREPAGHLHDRSECSGCGRFPTRSLREGKMSARSEWRGGCQDLVYLVKLRYWRPKPAVGTCTQGL